MDIKLTEVEKCKYNVSVMFSDSLEMERKKHSAISKYRNVKIPGFRQGKADDNSLYIKFKKQIEEDLKNDLASECFEETINQHKLKPLAMPQFSKAELGIASFNCEFVLLTKPEFTLQDYKFSFPKPDVQPPVEDRIQTILEQVRKQNGENLPFSDTDTVQLGDSLILTYSGRDAVDGSVIAELTSSNEVYEVGNSSLKEFDDNLLGMKVGEEKEFTITFPEHVHHDDEPAHEHSPLAGKKVLFTANLVMATKIVPMALDDSLAKKAANVDTLDEMMVKVRGMAEGKFKEELDTKISAILFSKLVESNTIDLPEWLKLAEARIMATQAKQEWDQVEDQQKEKYLALAENNIKFSLILEAVREKEPDAQLADSEALNMLKQWVAQSNNQNISEFITNLEKSGQLPLFLNRIKDQYTISFLIRNTTLVE